VHFRGSAQRFDALTRHRRAEASVIEERRTRASFLV
jgi:hypothetical protein